jgi:hypothetical protein
VPVAGIARIGEQHLVALVEQHPEGKQQGGARSRRNDDAARRDVDAVAASIEPRDRLAQLPQAERRGVVHALVVERLLRRIDDRLRRAEIGLADLQVDHVPALRLHLARECLDLHHLEGLDMGHAGREVQAPCRVVHRKRLKQNARTTETTETTEDITSNTHPRICAGA